MSSVEHTPTPADGGAEPRRLQRSRSNRWIAGVAGGLSEYFGLHQAVYRVLFVALAFAGGTGILLYLAAALVMPDETAQESVLAERLRRHRDRPWLVIGLALLTLAVVFSLSDGDGPGFGFGPVGFVLILVTGGAIFLWSRAARRDARRAEATGRRSRRWRTGAAVGAVTVLAALVGGAFAAAHATGGAGERYERPILASELDDEYELAFGRLELDLRDVQLPLGETRVDARVTFGELDIILPEGVPVAVTGDVRWGEADVLGRTDDGRDTYERVVDDGFADAPRRLLVDADVRGGELSIRR